jgi:hypothetical protein
LNQHCGSSDDEAWNHFEQIEMAIYCEIQESCKMILFENYTEILSQASRVVWDRDAFVVPWNFGEMTAFCL